MRTMKVVGPSFVGGVFPKKYLLKISIMRQLNKHKSQKKKNESCWAFFYRRLLKILGNQLTLQRQHQKCLGEQSTKLRAQQELLGILCI